MVKFFKENLQVFKLIALPLFILVVVSSNTDRYLNLRIESLLRDPSGDTGPLPFYILLSLLAGIFFPLLQLTWTLFGLNAAEGMKNTAGEFIHKFFNQVCIESLRAWGKILLWSLLLIIPGIIKFLQYAFVPLVVTNSSKYDGGKQDALQASAIVFKKNWGKVLLLFLAFNIVIPLIITGLFDAYRLIWKTPVPSLILNALDVYLLIISTQILFRIFKSEVPAHESHV